MTLIDRITTTAVVGSGYMGGGIAQVLALHGYKVALGDVDRETAERARVRLVEQARGFEAHGLLWAGAAGVIERNLSAAGSIEEAVTAADFISEAVPEEPELKASVLRRISAAAPGGAVIGTNTSAIPIGELAESVSGPERFLGVHWMNPAPFIPGVELIPGPATDPAVLRPRRGTHPGPWQSTGQGSRHAGICGQSTPVRTI
ncbi:3-hydroxyacyl-CoA dehydrogenase family protein [Arthrobacter psychrolactophilus]